MEKDPYKALSLTVGIHFFIMYALTYAAANTFNDVFLNVNRLYMAVIMVAPMIGLMLFFMSKMYDDKQLNMILYTVSIGLFVLFLTFIRQQTLVGDIQFLRSMIPHHSSAIVMCERSDIQDSEIKALCESIIRSQQEEIDQMKHILKRLN